MTNNSVFQRKKRGDGLLNLQRMAQITEKIAVWLEQFLEIALYCGSIVLSVWSADGMTIPDAGEISIQQAITSELLLVTPVYLTMTFRGFRWIRLPCCLMLGCATGVFLTVAGSISVWGIGLCLVRLRLLIPSRRHGRNLRFAGLAILGAVLKYLAC